MSNKTKHGKVPESLARIQERFAAHLRNPDKHPAPEDVEDRRMAIYRGLFFRNIRTFLSNNFPVLRKLYAQEDWDQLVREFYTEHRARTPLFPEIAREFLQYIQEQRQDRAGDPPFMLELAHYEWVELALALDENEIEEVPADVDGDLLTGAPVLSPLAWPLSYRFPVHRIQPDFQPQEQPPEATHLLVYRDRQDKVKFMQMNDITALLLNLLKEGGDATGHDLLNRIADELDLQDRQQLLTGGRKIFQDLFERDVILGTQPSA